MRRDSWYLSSCFSAFDSSWRIFQTIVARFLHFAGWQRASQRRPIDSSNNRTTYRFTRRGLHEDTVTSKLERHQASIAALSNATWLAVNGVFNEATGLASVSNCFFFLDNISHIMVPHLKLAGSHSPCRSIIIITFIILINNESPPAVCTSPLTFASVMFWLVLKNNHSFSSEVTTFSVFPFEFLLVRSSSRHAGLINFIARVRACSTVAV